MENESMYSQMRRESKDMADDMLEEIRESKYGKLKLEAISSIPLVWGSIMGSIGRVTGAHFLPAVPVGMDLMTNAEGYSTPKGFGALLKYGIGVALPYADIVYSTLQERIPELVQTLVDKI